jgi:hypothetical protein
LVSCRAGLTRFFSASISRSKGRAGGATLEIAAASVEMMRRASRR